MTPTPWMKVDTKDVLLAKVTERAEHEEHFDEEQHTRTAVAVSRKPYKEARGHRRTHGTHKGVKKVNRQAG
ncbi:hypothetical protein OK074_7761 [Actinobacteria bacterium OK074]|nr:hypothetical protein OK074_7761 [Actinobacteria bacterium OK074]